VKYYYALFIIEYFIPFTMLNSYEVAGKTSKLQEFYGEQ